MYWIDCVHTWFNNKEALNKFYSDSLKVKELDEHFKDTMKKEIDEFFQKDLTQYLKLYKNPRRSSIINAVFVPPTKEKNAKHHSDCQKNLRKRLINYS